MTTELSMNGDIRVEATEYAVCGLPEDDVNATIWRLTIERRGPDSWAVLRHSLCLSSTGEWEHEPLPLYRTDEWKATHRFSLREAARLAVETYPKLVINGYRVENGELVPA